MKRIILAFFLLAFLQSCKKDSSASGSIKFTVNGKDYNFKNTSDRTQAVEYYKLLPGQGFSNTIRYVVSGRNETSNNLIHLSFNTDLLTIGNYVLDYNSGGTVLHSIMVDSTDYVVFPGDKINFDVTALANNRISGTFSGVMSTINGNSKVMITNGVVSDIKFQE